MSLIYALVHERSIVTPHTIWSAWTFDPFVLVPVAIGAGLYARGVNRLWRKAGRGRGVARWQAMCFAAGIGWLIAALVSPLAALGGTLFSAHMVQHVVITGLAAPLLVLSAAGPALAWGLPAPTLAPLRAHVLHRSWFRAAIRMLTLPITAWTLHAAALWAWHAPSLYSATVHSGFVHGLQHFSFFTTALLFWWAGLRRSMRAMGVLYLFTTAVHGSLLGALLVLTPEPLYSPYVDSAPVWAFTALEDQQLGGLIMWVPAGLIYVFAALLLLASLLRARTRLPRWAVPLASAVMIGQ